MFIVFYYEQTAWSVQCVLFLVLRSCALVVLVNRLTDFSATVIKCLYCVYCELFSFYFLSINHFMSIWIVGFGPALVVPIRRNTKLSSDEGISTSAESSIQYLVRLLIICQSLMLNIAKKIKIYFCKYNYDFLKCEFVYSSTEEDLSVSLVYDFFSISNLNNIQNSQNLKDIYQPNILNVQENRDFFQIKIRNFIMTKPVMEKSWSFFHFIFFF